MTHEKHENHDKLNFHQGNFHFKVYVWIVNTKSMHTYPKHNWVHIYRFAWKANNSRGIHVYLKVCQNKHIHEMKAHDHSTNPKWEYKFKNVMIIKTRLY